MDPAVIPTKEDLQRIRLIKISARYAGAMTPFFYENPKQLIRHRSNLYTNFEAVFEGFRAAR